MRGVYESEHEAGTRLRVHRHRAAYAALVIDGGYREVGPDGVWVCGVGDLVVHPPFDLHGDQFERAGARVLNVEVPPASPLGLDRFGVVRLRDPGRLVRSARRDPVLALAEALEDAEPVPARPAQDWVDLLADRIRAEPGLRIGSAARALGVSAEHASREFARRYGIGPAAFRAEHRLRRALRELPGPWRPLREIAHDAGYADQAHMTRAVRTTTGSTPARLRRAWAQ